LPVQHGTVVEPCAARDPAAEGIVRGTHDPEMARDCPIRPFPQMDIGIQGPSLVIRCSAPAVAQTSPLAAGTLPLAQEGDRLAVTASIEMERIWRWTAGRHDEEHEPKFRRSVPGSTGERIAGLDRANGVP
jgi:hypothetical protein